MAQPAYSISFNPQPPVVLGRKPRTLVLCFDGTTNEYGTKNTNVVKFYSLLSKDHIEDQMCYYQAGIGTYFKPGAVRPIFRWAASMLDKAFAWYLSQHVLDGYRFLMQNYNTGDKVCLFGFSRGAYTARALAGMLHKVGLLGRDNDEQLAFAYKIYASSTKANAKLAEGFKRTFSRDVPIEFVGVWDTVASVGVVLTRTLPFVATNTTIRTFRQALALDEHRALFRPNLYHRPVPTGEPASNSLITHAKNVPFDIKHVAHDIGLALENGRHKLVDRVEDLLYGEQDDGESLPSAEGYTTDVEEVWFAGCHCDVGGSAVRDDAPHALANIPLRWMVREVARAQCVLFDDAAFARLNIPTPGSTAVGTPVDDVAAEGSVAGAAAEAHQEDQRDAQDAVQPLHDELKRNPLWWILETLIPTKYDWQKSANEWITQWGFHWFSARWVPDGAKFHESVKLREADKKLHYKPRAQCRAKGSEVYVS
ncbi:hypothetical protein FA95DRAFT_1583670 [Auriscalpium vulgare]|uniref:Uncharacterized protein n=1 Tax=Auriscalpium vulgare TaxID=40419 RepID=A0ACB8RL89_9AGAM|nr:hypothetical protein FA95DRAFT_1583670 [Auriscalpium vulgare]